ncbi:MAG: hypothetical protein H7233_09940, partial [Pseudorhodobacter sp.]|nr:hypothetical protein [Frankiaceae bacterium]
MELVDYFKLLRRRWLLIVAAVVVCLGGSVYSTSQQVRVYQSSVQFSLTDGAGRPVDTLLATAAQQRVPAYVTLATSGEVLGAVYSALPEGTRPGLLGVTVSGVAATVFMTITVSPDSAQGASQLASAFAKALPPAVKTFATGGGG